MTIQSKPMGTYQTNCYIITIDNKDIIIDPGMDATQWVINNVTNPIAILNTHGHFDHIWSNQEIQKELKIDIYCPKDDCFMLTNDPFEQGTPSSIANIEVEDQDEFIIKNLKFKFHHFPGHTPGCSIIEIEDCLFSGDFIFSGSIGRVDFPYSSPQDMKNSINKILLWNKDYKIYSGHGASTTLFKEKNSLKSWLNYI